MLFTSDTKETKAPPRQIRAAAMITVYPEPADRVIDAIRSAGDQAMEVQIG